VRLFVFLGVWSIIYGMQYSPEDSKDGMYDVYYQADGKKIIVLEGLDPSDTLNPQQLQNYIHQHYNVFELGYWLLFVTVLVYMAGLHVVLPVARRFKLF
jgi:hypothetical protein